MSFINARLLTLAWMLMMVSGCSSFDAMLTPEEGQTQNPVTESAQAVTPLDPFVAEVLALRAQGNQYQQQQSAVSVSEEIRQQFARGQAWIQDNKLDDARQLFLRLSEQQPQLSGIWLQLADIQQRELANTSDGATVLQQKQALENYLQQAATVNPLNYVAQNRLAMLYRQQGRFNQALQHYDLALVSWPAFPEARLNRAILNDLYLGNKQQALQDYQLYQYLLGKPDRQVKGWIADIERQIQQQQEIINRQSGTLKEESR